MGGTFVDKDKGQYVTPYVHSLWPEDVDPSECSAIAGREVDVRKHPNMNSPVIARLSHDIVRVDHTASQGGWERITTPDGREGHVFGAFIRSKYDWSAGFAKVDGEWMMKWLVSKPRGRRLPPPPPVTDPGKARPDPM